MFVSEVYVRRMFKRLNVDEEEKVYFDSRAIYIAIVGWYGRQ